jgi:hypothetical protein
MINGPEYCAELPLWASCSPSTLILSTMHSRTTTTKTSLQRNRRAATLILEPPRHQYIEIPFDLVSLALVLRFSSLPASSVSGCAVRHMAAVATRAHVAYLRKEAHIPMLWL